MPEHARADVKAEHRIDFRIVHHAGSDHRPRAARRWTFLRRLEQEFHRARNLRLHRREHLGGAHQDGDVHVVTAGVHDSHILAVVFGPHGGSERNGRRLLDGKRIHVCTKRHDRTGLATAQDADDAVAADAGLHFEPQRSQMIRDQLRRARFLEGQLRVRMDVVAPCGQLRRDRVRPAVDLGMNGIGSLRVGGQGEHQQGDGNETCAHDNSGCEGVRGRGLRRAVIDRAHARVFESRE